MSSIALQYVQRWLHPATAALALLLCLPSSALAHDFWIEPSDFRPAPRVPVTFRLRVGQNYEGDPVSRDPAQIIRFAALDHGKEKPVTGVNGRDPAGFATFDRSGLAVVSYLSNPHPIELQPQKFEDYLVQEGLEPIVAARGARGEHGKVGREQFSRCAKALLAVGNSSPGDFSRPVGLTLELIPEKNPYALKKGEALPLGLLFQGKPIGGVLVVAMNRARPENKLKVRTDAAGRALLPLDHQGEWLIKAVHMTPAPPGSRADWQSFWASLTFETGPKQGPSSLRGLEYVFVDTDIDSRRIIENAIAQAFPRVHLVMRADEAEIIARYVPPQKGGKGAGQIIKTDVLGKSLVAETYKSPASKGPADAFARWFIALYAKDNS